MIGLLEFNIPFSAQIRLYQIRHFRSRWVSQLPWDPRVTGLRGNSRCKSLVWTW